MGADKKGSSGGPLKVDVICVHKELMLSPSPSTSTTDKQTTFILLKKTNNNKVLGNSRATHQCF